MFKTSLDWKIVKKLIEAGGLGPRVYIRFPRNRFYWRECEMLLSQYRQVVLQRSNRNDPPIAMQWMPSGGVFFDHDILSRESYERAERIWNEYWDSVRQQKGE